jgi:type IV secretory pathway TrbF-like protein
MWTHMLISPFHLYYVKWKERVGWRGSAQHPEYWTSICASVKVSPNRGRSRCQITPGFICSQEGLQLPNHPA